MFVCLHVEPTDLRPHQWNRASFFFLISWMDWIELASSQWNRVWLVTLSKQLMGPKIQSAIGFGRGLKRYLQRHILTPSMWIRNPFPLETVGVVNVATSPHIYLFLIQLIKTYWQLPLIRLLRQPRTRTTCATHAHMKNTIFNFGIPFRTETGTGSASVVPKR